MERILGVESGGTKTSWAVVARDGAGFQVLEEGLLPPANLRLTSDAQLQQLLGALPNDIGRAGVFLAGCATDEDYASISKICHAVWPNAQIVIGSDRDSGFAAAFGSADGIAVNAGTGSSITGRRGERTEKAGGWGHILGDAGGGYDVSLQALRLVLREYDLRRAETELSYDILRALCLNSRDQLVRWAQTADKTEIAMLAPVVFAAARRGDAKVQEILRNGARVLAEYTSAVAERLEFAAPAVRLLGGLFFSHSVYAEMIQEELHTILPAADVQIAAQRPVFGAAWLAMGDQARPLGLAMIPRLGDSPQLVAATEEANVRSADLEKMSARELVELFVEEESVVQEALRAGRDELVRAIDLIADALAAGGRLFYVGAGTSGRLGVLDASEIPPTFGASLELVQGIMAGGAAALWRSVEGAEDDGTAGRVAIEGRGVRAGDVVCGIAASGRTPFVLQALSAARERGAKTILLTCNPKRARDGSHDIEIDLPTGAELVTGSTRLKAGTATKVALNILSTGAMVRLGRVRGNTMVDVVASNAKLRDRAARLVAEARNCTYEAAIIRLEQNAWSVRRAIDATA